MPSRILGSILLITGVLVCLGLTGCSEDPERIWSPTSSVIPGSTGFATGFDPIQPGDALEDYTSQGYDYPDGNFDELTQFGDDSTDDRPNSKPLDKGSQ